MRLGALEHHFCVWTLRGSIIQQGVSIKFVYTLTYHLRCALHHSFRMDLLGSIIRRVSGGSHEGK